MQLIDMGHAMQLIVDSSPFPIERERCIDLMIDIEIELDIRMK
jgi:hypothetical protein